MGSDLRLLGLQPGDTVLVHASLRALGWVSGGAAAVVRAFLDVLESAGTVVVPAHTAYNRDPSTWTDYPVPREQWLSVRAALPAFDPRVTPSSGMGTIAEQVRTWRGAVRSDHPQSSFAAVGPAAEGLLRGHALTSHLGEESPLRRLEDIDAWVLLLGVGWGTCTAFHLGEYRQPDPPVRSYSCVTLTPRGREWVTFPDIVLDDRDFAELGADFEATRGGVVSGQLGNASARFFRIRAATDFATWWLRRRQPAGTESSVARCGPGRWTR